MSTSTCCVMVARLSGVRDRVTVSLRNVFSISVVTLWFLSLGSVLWIWEHCLSLCEPIKVEAIQCQDFENLIESVAHDRPPLLAAQAPAVLRATWAHRPATAAWLGGLPWLGGTGYTVHLKPQPQNIPRGSRTPAASFRQYT